MNALPVLYPLVMIADLLNVPVDRLKHLVSRGIHPPWIWLPGWPEPRWSENTISQWHRIIDGVEAEQHGSGDMAYSQHVGATIEELEIARKMLPKPDLERLRANDEL